MLTAGVLAAGQASPLEHETPPERGFRKERMKGLEPSTFCMASRRSSQLSYIRVAPMIAAIAAVSDWGGATGRGRYVAPSSASLTRVSASSLSARRTAV